MGRARKFDWDEARRLRAQGMTYAAIAAQLGVTSTAVALACDDRARAMAWARSAEYQRQHGNPFMYDTCACGGRKHTRAKRCRACWEADHRKQIDEHGNLWCHHCKRYLAPRSFSADFRLMETRKGRRRVCTECDTKMRREYTEAHKVPCANGCGRKVRSETAKRGTGLCHVCATASRNTSG